MVKLSDWGRNNVLRGTTFTLWVNFFGTLLTTVWYFALSLRRLVLQDTAPFLSVGGQWFILLVYEFDEHGEVMHGIEVI